MEENQLLKKSKCMVFDNIKMNLWQCVWPEVND
jgi:hypothetical protein